MTQQDKAKFLRLIVTLADKYDITVQVNWDDGILSFTGDVEPTGWHTLIGELELASKNWNTERSVVHGNKRI